MRRLSLLILFLTMTPACRERAVPAEDRAATLKRLRQCRPQLEKALVERLEADAPDAVVRGLTPAQRPALAERLFQELFEGFFLGGPGRDFARYLAASPGRACFTEAACDGLARCLAKALAGPTYAGIEDLELPAVGPAAVGTVDTTPLSGTRTPSPPAPVDPPPPPAELTLTTERFDLAKPDPRTDFGIPWDPAAPRVWFTARDRLRLVTPEGGKLRALREIPLPSFWSAADDPGVPEIHVTRHGAVLVRTTRAIMMLARDGATHVVWKTADAGKKIGAMTLWEDRVVLAAEGGLIVLDGTFRELGRVSFGLGEGKDGHHVLMHGDEALVLDNRALPYYVFRVDLLDPGAPQILDDVEDHAASAHLLHQWTDEKAGLWAVLRSTYGRGGNHQMILALDLRKPATRVKHEFPPGAPRFIGGHPSVLHHIEAYSESFLPPPTQPRPRPGERVSPMARTKRTGMRFHVGSSRPPGWVLATDDRGLHLGRYVLRPPKAEFEVGRTIVAYGGAAKREGRVRLDEESIGEEDPFAEADGACAMDHREDTVVVVHDGQLQVLGVAGGRVRPVATVTNPLGQPSRVRIHR